MVPQVAKVSTVAKVEELDPFEDEYVYDIGMASNDPYFFANDLLVHNSCYFSAAMFRQFLAQQSAEEKAAKAHLRPFTEEELDFLLSSRETTIDFYDAVAEAANDAFPEFMNRNFHTTLERGGIIKGGRELVGSQGLFIKKKKYAILCYDVDGDRLDKDGKPGKLKAMGLDLKRADTPKYMQKFLNDMLMDLLTGKPREDLYEDIKTFRTGFEDRPGWEKGAPKKVSNLTGYSEKAERAASIGVMEKVKKGEKLKVQMPGHVKAAINWNSLCDLNDDRYAMRITDGTRIIVVKLMPNAFRMDSVAYPIDEPHLPQWFKNLPFDHEAMAEVIIDNKVLNLVGVLNWDLSKTKARMGDEFFSFGDPEPEKEDTMVGHNGGPAWDEDDDE